MIHELRCYKTMPGKKAALIHRFFNGTFALFEQHGFKLICFWERPDADELWYVLEWPGRDEMARGWELLKSDNAWKKLKATSEAEGPLIESVSSVVLNVKAIGGKLT